MARIHFKVLERSKLTINGLPASCKIVPWGSGPLKAKPEWCDTTRLTFHVLDGIETCTKHSAKAYRRHKQYHHAGNPAKARQGSKLAGPPTGTNFGG
jgi:hypothetical protein